MLCPKCNKEMDEMWRETWKPVQDDIVTTVVARCWECDFDGTCDIDEKGNEINFRQYFPG